MLISFILIIREMLISPLKLTPLGIIAFMSLFVAVIIYGVEKLMNS